MWASLDDAHEFSVQPLLITPEITARAKADQQAQAQSQARAEAEAREESRQAENTAKMEQLQGMFPDFDLDVVESVLNACGGDMETVVSQLLEMNGGPAAEPSHRVDSDEELAMLLFQQFAEDIESHLNEPIPPDIRNDPRRFEAFVREKLESALQQEDSSFARQANQLFQTSAGESFAARGGKEGFLDRLKKMRNVVPDQRGGGRGDDKRERLLD